MSHSLLRKLAITAGALSLVPAAYAGGLKYKDGDKYLKIGGRMHLQYHLTDPDTGTSSDELKFRRLRPYIEGSLHKNWKGKWQWDLGKSEVAIKDAYFKYTGFQNFSITIGNAKTAFSRELLTSSNKQTLVERTFNGDHNWGVPDRQPGIHFGSKGLKHFTWDLTLAKAGQDPDTSKLDFESPVDHETGSDWSEGLLLGGRIEFQPAGPVKLSQGDMKGKSRWYIGLGAFTWSNDDDNVAAGGHGGDTTKRDVDSVSAIEFGLGYRGHGFSIDAQYDSYSSELIDAGITSGIYSNSETTLDVISLEGSFMIVRNTFEIGLGFESLDADTFADEWTRFSVGLNYYVKKHDIKYQLTYRAGENVGGTQNNDVNELFLQAQYVF